MILIDYQKLFLIEELIPYVGHVQVSQTPERNCPMNEDGEVNHRYFLSKLIAPFYQDYVGLEYFGKTQVLINISIDDFIFIYRFKQRII